MAMSIAKSQATNVQPHNSVSSSGSDGNVGHTGTGSVTGSGAVQMATSDDSLWPENRKHFRR